MLIVDASVLVEVALGNAAAEKARDDQGASGRLIAPELVDAEVANALKGHERAGNADREVATAFVRSLVHLPLRRVSLRVLLPDAWNLRHRLSTYDAFYVALARRFEAPVLTCDRRWAAAGDLGITVITVG